MDKHIMEIWVDALRSGNYKQGVGSLQNQDKEFCCLGVLCDLLGMETRPDGFFVSYPTELPHDVIGDHGSFPLDGIKGDPIVQLTTQEKNLLQERRGNACRIELPKLSHLNDYGFTFKEIANIIERNADTI